MSAPIERIDWHDGGAAVTVAAREPAGIDADTLVGFIADIHLIRRWVGGMSAEQRARLGPEAILLLRDLAPHLLCAPIADA